MRQEAKRGRFAPHMLLPLLASLPAVVCVVIFVFLVVQSWTFFQHYKVADFLFSSEWAPKQNRFGVLPMIVGSLYVTFGAAVFGVPVGLGTGVFIAEIAPQKIREPLHFALLLLAGVPPIIYGFFGLVVLVPFVRQNLGGSGFSVLAASIMLGVLILPIVASGTESAIQSVPMEYREAALALGASKSQLISGLLLKLARPGITAAVVLGLARAMAETMIVVMVTGNVARYPVLPHDPTRTLTGNIALEIASSVGDHRQALFGTALVLFIFSLGTLATTQLLLRSQHRAA